MTNKILLYLVKHKIRATKSENNVVYGMVMIYLTYK